MLVSLFGLDWSTGARSFYEKKQTTWTCSANARRGMVTRWRRDVNGLLDDFWFAR